MVAMNSNVKKNKTKKNTTEENLFSILLVWNHPGVWKTFQVPSQVSLTLLSQTWSSSRSSQRVSTGSSWSAEAAARSSLSTPERAALPRLKPSPQRQHHHHHSPAPVSPVILPSQRCLITTLSSSSPSSSSRGSYAFLSVG